VVGPSEQEAVCENGREHYNEEQGGAIGQGEFPSPPPKKSHQREAKKGRDECARQIECAAAEGLDDHRQARNGGVHRHGGVRREAEGRIFKIVKTKGVKRMRHHALDPGHAGIAIGIHEIGLSAGKNLRPIPAARGESEGQKHRQSDDRQESLQDFHLFLPDPISCGFRKGKSPYPVDEASDFLKKRLSGSRLPPIILRIRFSS